MSGFADLKSEVEDQPQQLQHLASTDEKVADQCRELVMAANHLRAAERRKRDLFARPVNPNFIAAWRDYEDRYAEVLSGLSIFLLFGLPVPSNTRVLPPKSAAEKWRDADSHGFVSSDALEQIVEFAFHQGTDTSRWGDDDIKQIEDGVGAWDELRNSAGFDLRGVLRRRSLVPFVLVPRHVAETHGTERISMLYASLAQAQEAFVYGAPYAALALMRTIMEATIREHYQAKDDSLKGLLNSLGAKLPDGVQLPRLHRLRDLANALLHANPDKKLVKRLQAMDQQQLELEIVSFLLTLRALIEGAPR